MVGACYLEVDVNGEGKFLVDKEILLAYSGRLNKLFEKSSVKGAAETLKVIFHGLPGGPEAFELMIRFCYNNGSSLIIPTNTCLLHFLACFMEMTEEIASCNLMRETAKALKGISEWSWSEILTGLKQCQEFFTMANSSGAFDKILDCLVGRIVTVNDTSPSGSSPESSAFRFSFDTRSTVSTKNSCYRAWWFEDLLVLNSDTMDKAIRRMVSKKLDHATISKFLFFYLKHRCLNATTDEKIRAAKVVIDLLYTLDKSCVSCKCLFGVLRVTSALNLSECCRSKLESMIGSQIDQATLDNLLVPAPNVMDCLYDVNLVLRFLKHFLHSRDRISASRLKMVGSLMDSYIAEIAPDPSLKPSKFVAIAAALPEAARDSHDAIYRAIDMYLEVHSRLSEEEKMRICCVINCEKLSLESCKHLARNAKFPSRAAIQSLITQQAKLKRLLQDSNYLRKFCSSHHEERQCSEVQQGFHHKEEKCSDVEQVILYSKKLDLSIENDKLKAHLQGMQWRVMELEKMCRKMQTQMAKMMKNKLATPSGARSLPKLCS